MKRILTLALTILCALALLPSCQKAPELTITSPSSVELSADGSSGSITFMANRAWRVSSSDSWVTLSPSSGEPSETPVTVSVRCNANTTYEDRSATVTITMEELSQKVTVRQPANKGIVLPTQSYDLQSGAKTIEVTVQANVDYTVETSVDWIKQTGTKGLTSKTLNFSIEENKTYDAREGKIIIKPTQAGVAEQVISVKQAQKDALIVEKTSYDMPYGGGEIEIKVEANVAFDVTPDSEWFHHISTKALSSSTVLIKVDENTTYSAREGKIEIAQQNGTLKHTITVKEAGRIAVTSVELDQTSLTLKPEETATLVATVKPDNATDKTVTWTSSDASIATVDETGKVTAIKDGPATITAKAGDKSATCKVTVKSYVGIPVDLGVAMMRADGTFYNLCWADCNLGALIPEGYGEYYAWGEIEAKTSSSSGSYKWINENNEVIKYFPSIEYGAFGPKGIPDDKTKLEPEDDAAHIKLGGEWRMPTIEEVNTLIKQCTRTWTTRNGVNGCEVKSTLNGNSIFLPAAGEWFYSGIEKAGQRGTFWTSSLYEQIPTCAYSFTYVDNGSSSAVYNARTLGLSIRPVLETSLVITSVEISKNTLDLKEGVTEQLSATFTPQYASENLVYWSSSDESIAKVDAYGRVGAVKEGVAIITAKVGDKTASCTVNVIPRYPVVDLGLSVKWAAVNVGAEYRCDPGEPFSWGEVKKKENYTWNTYMWGKGETSLKKYITKDGYIGEIDNKTRLELEDDAATVWMGEGWRTPTVEEWNELVSKCSWTYGWLDEDNHSIQGYTVVGPNGKSIFLPAAGGTKGEYKKSGYNNGSYWSSDVDQDEPFKAKELFFTNTSHYTTSVSRFMGNAVRGVRSE